MNVLAQQVYIDDRWAFVGSSRRLGEIKRVGPITGIAWLITPTGSWIDAEDAAELVEAEEQVWCWRLNDWLTLNPVFYLNPTSDQVATKPQG